MEMQWHSSGHLEMNGRRFILDTNAIIFLLKGNQFLLDAIKSAEWVGISVISKIEFLAFPRLSESDSRLFEKFLERVDIINLADGNKELLSNIIKIRKSYKIKLPDAIVISTAVTNNSILITADKQLKRVEEVEIVSFDA